MIKKLQELVNDLYLLQYGYKPFWSGVIKDEHGKITGIAPVTMATAPTGYNVVEIDDKWHYMPNDLEWFPFDYYPENSGNRLELLPNTYRVSNYGHIQELIDGEWKYTRINIIAKRDYRQLAVNLKLKSYNPDNNPTAIKSSVVIARLVGCHVNGHDYKKGAVADHVDNFSFNNYYKNIRHASGNAENNAFRKDQNAIHVETMRDNIVKQRSKLEEIKTTFANDMSLVQRCDVLLEQIESYDMTLNS
jgi:hypothetical protein